MKQVSVYSVRAAQEADLPRILEIYAAARKFMAEHGNPNQWGATHPPAARTELDIAQKLLYVVAEEEVIHGVFYFHIGEDPTYGVIDDGAWHAERPYGTIHRIAGDGSGGILRTAIAFAAEKIDYLRIDTHQDNSVMQHALKKLGFSPCGTIYTDNGSPRIAFDLIIP